jgi:hypothetical protein
MEINNQDNSSFKNIKNGLIYRVLYILIGSTLLVVLLLMTEKASKIIEVVFQIRNGRATVIWLIFTLLIVSFSTSKIVKKLFNLNKQESSGTVSAVSNTIGLAVLPYFAPVIAVVLLFFYFLWFS